MDAATDRENCDSLLTKGLQVFSNRNKVRFFPETGKGHLGAFDVGFGLREEFGQRAFIPDAALLCGGDKLL